MKCEDEFVPVSTSTEVMDNKIETESVSSAAHQFVCMPNCLCVRCFCET